MPKNKEMLPSAVYYKKQDSLTQGLISEIMRIERSKANMRTRRGIYKQIEDLIRKSGNEAYKNNSK